MAKNRTILIMDYTGLDATTTGETMSLVDYSTFHVVLDVTASTGTSETLDVVIEHSVDGTNWLTHTAFTQATGVTEELKTLTNVLEFVRAKATLGGTSPTFDFTLAMSCKV